MLNPISSIRLGAGALALILGVAAPASARFRTRGPIVCKDSQHMTVYNVRIATRGVAVIAKDNCELTIVKSQIRAGVAIKASENAVVKLVRCDVSGQKSAVVASDNAEVHAKRGTIWGAIRTSDNGEFKGRARRMKRARPLGVLTVGGVVAVRTGSGTTAVRTGTGGVAMRVGPNGVAVRTGHGRTTVRTGHGRTTVRTGHGR
ncbi:MAG: hypothetical protein KAI47_10325, partial [Deltaproteobacteria bacterium]|nr:hypothetical protein [Deltaproteobacteria bacterium]